MVILVIGGYQWLSEVISDIENNFMHFKVMVIMVIDGYLWLLLCISRELWLSWLSVVTNGYLRLLVILRIISCISR